MPVVSVLMPCYNAAGARADALEAALESLSRQSLADFEVVLVDDGSTDETPARLHAWAARDGRFRVLRQPHGGIIAALNAGLEACRAPFVARMDADDCSHPRRLERQAAYLEAHPEVAAAGCLVQGFPAGQVREGFRIYLEWLNSLVDDADIRREMFVESPLAHPSVTFRKAWIEEAGGYQEHGWPEDYDLWLRLYLAGARFGKVAEYLFEWREHPARLTRTDSRYSLENFLRAKAHYLARGPLAGRDPVYLWGAGMIGRRISKHLQREGAPLYAFFDLDPRKIGNTRRGLPILPAEALPALWEGSRRPALLATVGARGARPILRERFGRLGLMEGEDWWFAA